MLSQEWLSSVVRMMAGSQARGRVRGMSRGRPNIPAQIATLEPRILLSNVNLTAATFPEVSVDGPAFPLAEQARASKVGVDDNGNVIVVWEKSDQIFMQGYHPDGSPNGSPVLVAADADFAALDDYGFDLAVAGDGSFSVAWSAQDSAIGKSSVSVSRYRAVGDKIDTRVLAEATRPEEGSDRVIEPRVAINDEGSTVVVWTRTTSSVTTVSTTIETPWGPFVLEDEVPVDTAKLEGAVLKGSEDTRFIVTEADAPPAVYGARDVRGYAQVSDISFGMGGAVAIVWHSDYFRIGNPGYDELWITEQDACLRNFLVTPSGVSARSDRVVIANQTSSPKVGVDGSGNSLVVWEKDGLFARRFSPSGSAVSAAFPLVPVHVPHFAPVEVAADGSFAVATIDSTVLNLRSFKADGTPLAAPLEITTGNPDSQYFHYAVNSTGRGVVTWAQDNEDFSGTIYMRRLAAAIRAPTIGGLPTNLSVNDNATLAPFSAITVIDPHQRNMLARVTIFNGVVRGDFTAASTNGWTRTTSGNNVVYNRFYNPVANIGSVVQAALRGFVFVPRTNAIKPNTTELTDVTVFVNDGVANTTASTRLTTTSVNNAPTFGGSTANVAVNDNVTVNPLAALTVSDLDTQEVLISVTILNGKFRGDFTNANAGTGWTVRYTTGNDITYKRYFSPQANVGAAAQAAFRALVFQPRANAIKPGTTEATDFQVTVSDGVAPAVLGTGTRVTTTSVNNAPNLGGAVANQTMNDNQTKAIFSTFTVSDPDTQDQFVRITIANGTTRGDFTAVSTVGWTRKLSGANILYERFFTAAANNGAVVQAAIRALIFQPRNNVPTGTTETTSFTVFVNDGIVNATNGTTSVVTTGVAPRQAAEIPTAPFLDSDITTIVLPTVTRSRSNPLARLLKKSRP